MLQAVAGRAQIVYQHDGFDTHFLGERFGFDNPGQIRRVDAVIDDRTGYAKSRSPNLLASKMRGGSPRKFPDDEIELCEFLAGKALTKDEFQFTVLFRKESQIAFGTTNVACENHLTSRAKPY